MAMDEEFPILESVYRFSQTEDHTGLILPKTLQAPHPRHLRLFNAALPIGSPLLTTTMGLVSLTLIDIAPSTTPAQFVAFSNAQLEGAGNPFPHSSPQRWSFEEVVGYPSHDTCHTS